MFKVFGVLEALWSQHKLHSLKSSPVTLKNT